jgi:cytochrome c biogenesis protein ResB
MGIGLTVAFYLVHARIWVVPLRDTRGQLTLWFGGACNKNREAFQQKFDVFATRLEKELVQQSRSGSEACIEVHATSVAGD